MISRDRKRSSVGIRMGHQNYKLHAGNSVSGTIRPTLIAQRQMGRSGQQTAPSSKVRGSAYFNLDCSQLLETCNRTLRKQPQQYACRCEGTRWELRRKTHPQIPRDECTTRRHGQVPSQRWARGRSQREDGLSSTRWYLCWIPLSYRRWVDQAVQRD